MDKRPTRSINVTIITLFVLFITIWNAIRTYSAIANWQVLSEYKAEPAYIFATGMIWSLTGLGFIIGILKQARHYILSGLVISGLFYLWYWCDRFFIQSSLAPNVMFSVVFSTVLLAVFVIILSTSG
jgi:hypothetical protein